jgi:hypothetical protein
MRTTSKVTRIAAGVVALSAVLAGCGPKKSADPAPSTTVVTPGVPPVPSTSSTHPSTSPPQTLRQLTPGNCTTYTKADAVKLLGGVNINNKSLDIKTDGGSMIDACSYLDLKGSTDLQGVSYALVRYDSAATAFAKAQKVQSEMLGDAAEHKWQVQSLTTRVPGAGPVLGGYGVKTDLGVQHTIAVVGTNVGSYLVVALGASTENAGNAKDFAVKLFQALSAATQ